MFLLASNIILVLMKKFQEINLKNAKKQDY